MLAYLQFSDGKDKAVSLPTWLVESLRGSFVRRGWKVMTYEPTGIKRVT